jgi:hypothetical protein
MSKRWNGRKMSHGKKSLHRAVKSDRLAKPAPKPKQKKTLEPEAAK